jgi:hypothetical protein
MKCGYTTIQQNKKEGKKEVKLESRMGKDEIIKKLIESGEKIK